MSLMYRMGCWLFDHLLSLHSEELQLRYGDEMKLVFREQLLDARKKGPMAVASVWRSVACETISVAGPRYIGRLGLMALSTFGASVLSIGFALSFCSFGGVRVVHGCGPAEAAQSGAANSAIPGRLVAISQGHYQGHKMFLECTGESHQGPTVILATGRGIGSYQGWALVQSRVAAFAHVCSYDPLGAGKSDHVPGTHPVSEVVEEMHDLFHSAQLPQPFVLVGASAGGVLIRHYEERYPSDVAGFVFVDSAHEEMEWRDAAIAPSFDPYWNNRQYLEENGLLPPQQRLAWHDDVPTIVLERTDLPPCSAFPGLAQSQCDQLNQAWQAFQIDLAHRSRYGQLRPVAGSGHLMPQQKPEAISQAVSDVIREIKRSPKR
ncbi:MAG TPA: alpha/beta fold hydrolase [Acidobacteriaceae bacterium]|jgi:pimeloyl-ACP methyl ester carboxylesterase